jgi:hypothetical protein
MLVVGWMNVMRMAWKRGKGTAAASRAEGTMYRTSALMGEDLGAEMGGMIESPEEMGAAKVGKALD